MIGGASGGSGRGSRGLKPAFWLVASGLQANESVETVNMKAKNALLQPRAPLCDEVGILDVPLNLKFGSFDDLIRSVDLLQKHDSTVEGVLRRVERQSLELDPDAQFKIVWQRHSLSVEQYIRRFTWDDAKFPRSRSVRENIEAVVLSVTKLDDEVRAKVAVWQDARQQVQNVAGKKEALAYSQRELLDVLTPEVVMEGDFVETEHLTTVVVVVPGDLVNEWIKGYERLQQFVVPRSAKRFELPEDKDGATLWRVIVFKKGVDELRQAAAAKKFTVREFKYSADVYKQVVESRSKIEAEHTKQEAFLGRICFAAFSDIFVAWMHLKVMRVFCEAVLRFGVPPRFASLFMRPLSDSKEGKLRKELENIVAVKGLFGNKFYANDAGDAAEDAFYPYVWLTMQPFSA